MPNDAKVSQLIVRLTKATVDKEIQWKFDDPPPSLTTGTDDIISTYLVAEYKGQRLAVFERRYRGYDEENDSSFWTADFALVILDAWDRIVWDYRPGPTALDDLYRVARDSASGIEKILGILSE